MKIEKKIKLKENEQIISITRRYGLTFFWQWLLVLILLAVPFFFMFWLFNHSWWGQGLFFISISLALFILIRILFLWQKNILVVTTHRLVDFDQRGFFHQLISNVTYDQVEDIMGQIKGFWGTVFRYGDVEIQTGAGKVKIIVDRVKKPQDMQINIQELRDRFMSRQAREYSQDVAGTIIDQLYELELADLFKIQDITIKRINKLKS